MLVESLIYISSMICSDGAVMRCLAMNVFDFFLYFYNYEHFLYYDVLRLSIKKQCHAVDFSRVTETLVEVKIPDNLVFNSYLRYYQCISLVHLSAPATWHGMPH